MYKIRIIAEGVTSAGQPLAVGAEIEHADAWVHCLPGFRNAKPIAEPADDVTTQKVESERIALTARAKVQKVALQSAVNDLAKKLPTDAAGDFERTSKGTVKGASKADQAVIDNASAYEITPASADTAPANQLP